MAALRDLVLVDAYCVDPQERDGEIFRVRRLLECPEGAFQVDGDFNCCIANVDGSKMFLAAPDI